MKSKLLELQTSLGFNYVPTGVLQHPDLDIDIPQVLTRDYMHVYLVGGVFVVEFSSSQNVIPSRVRRVDP
eukprot:168013-Pyramimonas_sp.AAC.1